MNNYERLEGMVAATFTPMDENGDVNLSVIEKYADWIASTPIKGVFVCGTTGEFSSLTIDERKLILEKWVASAGKRFKVIAHVGSNCQRSAMELACHAEKAGADAIASIAPSFFKPGTVDELIDFFAPVCRSATAPIDKPAIRISSKPCRTSNLCCSKSMQAPISIRLL